MKNSLGIKLLLISLLILSIGWGLGQKPESKSSVLERLVFHLRQNHSSAIYEKFIQLENSGHFSHYPIGVFFKQGDTILANGKSEYKPRIVNEQLAVLKEGLDTLLFIEGERLEPCQHIRYLNHRFKFERDINLLSRNSADLSVDEILKQNKRDMESWASFYYGQTLDFETLDEIANTEITDVEDSYNRLKTKHHIQDLDLFAKKSELFESSAKDYKDQFLIAMGRVRNISSGYFYDYELKPANIFIVGRCHSYRAYASYDTKGRISIYECGQDRFDLKRNMFLAAHEYFPGHHLHYDVFGSSTTCSTDIRPNVGLSEALATYGEYLVEAELFAEADQLLGWLDYRMIRALRIKIDIARHRDGADKATARQFWEELAPGRLHDNFDDEYLRISSSTKFQYLKYELGRRSIMRVKQKLQAELGEEFDEKLFHHVLLTYPIQNGRLLYDQIKIGLSLGPPSEFKLSAPQSKLAN